MLGGESDGSFGVPRTERGYTVSNASLVVDPKAEHRHLKYYQTLSLCDERLHLLQICFITTINMPGTIPDTREIVMNRNAYPCTVI